MPEDEEMLPAILLGYCPCMLPYKHVKPEVLTGIRVSQLFGVQPITFLYIYCLQQHRRELTGGTVSQSKTQGLGRS